MTYPLSTIQKVKSPPLKPMQFHNQTHPKTRTNDHIHHHPTPQNYHFKNHKNIHYNQPLKQIIQSQKTPTTKTTKHPLLLNHFLLTSHPHFFHQLHPPQQKPFFHQTYKLFSQPYPKQNIAYA
ncbi:plasmid recombination protein, partial [Staphylococcus epidermidis]|uniref:plasmid recombination protein n=1 Tax=Staphylococcus epidermidis TaxID=1282 RepID=UPI0037D9B677